MTTFAGSGLLEKGSFKFRKASMRATTPQEWFLNQTTIQEK